LTPIHFMVKRKTNITGGVAEDSKETLKRKNDLSKKKEEENRRDGDLRDYREGKIGSEKKRRRLWSEW